MIWDHEDPGSIPGNPTVTLAQRLEHPNVARRVAGSNPVRHPNFILAPLAQLAEASDLGSEGSEFDSPRGYAGSSSPTAEAPASNPGKSRFESGGEYVTT